MEKSRTYTKMKNNLLSKTKIPMGIFFIVLLFAACNNKTEQNVDTKADTTEKANVEAADASTNFDVVILNGRVMDPETNFDGVQNVGILDGKIALITEKEIKGKKTIDAKGQVVSPGFIDLHAHGQNLGDYRMQAMQGVTTMLELESGILPINSWYDSQGKKYLP
ncbi:MAG: amidohydrolase family protein [Flavobacteriaceae bacterium]